jgi:chemotaxis protein CheX
MRIRIGRNYWRAQIEPLQLPAVLDVKAASALQQQFLDRRGTALQVDASRVERLGGLCLQVLLAAQAAWTADRQALVFENPSHELRAGLGAFGVAPDALTYREG